MSNLKKKHNDTYMSLNSVSQSVGDAMPQSNGYVKHKYIVAYIVAT